VQTRYSQPIANTFPEKAELAFQTQREYLVNGELKTWYGNTQDVFSPIIVRNTIPQNDEYFCKKHLGFYPLMDEATVLEILQNSVEAYDYGSGLWPTLSVRERISHVKEFVEEMEKQREEIVKLIMWEICKTENDAINEFERTIKYVNETISALIDLTNSSGFIDEQGITAQIRRSPLGIVLCMGPFNYPLNETFTTLIPALIMGNVVVFKPPKFGTLLFRPLLGAFAKCFPPGVINTVYGEGKTVISPLMASGKVDVLAFIGTSKVADILRKQHPKPHRLKCVLGLEAKNVAIITNSCSIPNAVAECVTGALSYNGQRCTALKLLFVDRRIKQPFLEAFQKEVNKLICGLPWDDKVKITPLPEDNKAEFLNSLIQDALEKGAHILTTHNEFTAKMQTLLHPVVLIDVNSTMRIFYEEQFGPVVPIVFYDAIDEAIQSVVDSNYGQQASIFGTDAVEVGKLVDCLVNQVCRINLNCQCQRGPDSFPFNGRKDSAENTLSITDALKVFSIRTVVATKISLLASDINRVLVNKILEKRTSNFLNTNYII